MGEGEDERGEEGDEEEILTWRQTAFQDLTTNHRDKHTKYRHCKCLTSPFGDFPSSKIRLDICPPGLLPGSNTEADSQIKIARGTIQTVLPFCRECLLTVLDLRG